MDSFRNQNCLLLATPVPPNPEIHRDEAVITTRKALLDSVRHHFVSDVPVGIFLSGGIDSTALLALAKEAGQSDIATFSVGVAPSLSMKRKLHGGRRRILDLVTLRHG